jgi:hypothetical protein
VSHEVTFFQPPQRPNGGGTVFARPSDSGNPYARIDEDPSLPRPVVVVELPEYEEGQK